MKHTDLTESRVHELLQSYGADPLAWPDAEREQAIACIAGSKALRALQQQAAELDALLGSGHSENGASLQENSDHLARRILEDLPNQNMPRVHLQRRLARLRTARMPALITAMAATVLLFVAVLRVSTPLAPPAVQAVAFEQWAWNDITGQDLLPAAAGSEPDFMELLELEAGDT